MTQEIEYNALRNPMEVGLDVTVTVPPSSISHTQTISQIYSPSPIPAARLETLHRRMSKLEKVMLTLNKKENYVNAMAVDLEHIITILIKRLDGDDRKDLLNS